MKTSIHIFKAITWFAIACLALASCKDDETEKLALNRQFTPAKFDIAPGETSVVIDWSPSLFTVPGEVEYKIELSTTQAFTAIAYTATVGESELTLQDTDIDVRTDYYVRVKALGKNGANDSNWLVGGPAKITGELFILPINKFDIQSNAVIIKWLVNEGLAKIVLTPQGGASFDATINTNEASAGEKLITGLTENTTYLAELFSNDGVSKGAVSFRTSASYSESNIVDLRGITGKPKILADTLPDIPSGSVVFLKRGETYTIDSSDPEGARVFNKSVTIVSGDDFIYSLATIHLTTNFNFAANSVIDSVVFRNVNIKGVRPLGASFDNDYVLNVNSASTVGVIRLDGCRISKLRGVVRMQAGTTGAIADNYFINNCVVDSIREFGVVMASGASYYKNVKISNSTFYKCRRFADVRIAGTQNFVIDNCTFNEVASGNVEAAETNYFLDFTATNTVANGVIISNSIMGKAWNEGAGEFVRGVRSSGVNVTMTNAYSTSDYRSTNASFQLTGFIGYSGTSTSLFTNPANGDFTIKDSSFPGASTAGDPRWRP